MPPKRLLSDLPFEDMNGDDWRVKKRKTHPRRSTIKTVIQDFEDMLSPVTSESLAQFNTQERTEGRRGVIALDAVVLSRRTKQLMVAMDDKAVDAKIKKLDEYLALKQEIFSDYINDAREKGHAVYTDVAGTLVEVVERIEAAREQLQGMPSYWMNRYRKANCSRP